MPMTAGSIVAMVFLTTTIGITVWYFVVAYKYKQTLNNFSYTRGANLDTKDKNKGTVNLKCESGAEICVWKATAICTGPLRGAASNSEGGPEPISNGLNGNSAYGDFDINNTIDLTADMAGQANGKQSYTYNFDTTKKNFGGNLCPMNYDTKSGTGVRPQLISTYTCIPKGTKCQSSKPPTPPTPPTPPNPPTFHQLGKFTGTDVVTMNNNNQVCGINNTAKIVQCVDNYVTNPVWNDFKGYASQISLSDNGSMVATNPNGSVFYNNNFKDETWTYLPNIPSSTTVTNRFNPSQQTYAGISTTGGILWTATNNNPKKLAAYGWTNMDSNKNGDMCGIANGGTSRASLQYLPYNAQSPINVTTPFTPTQVSINKSGTICATTTKGDIMCTPSASTPNWSAVSTGQNYTSLSMDDAGIICAVGSGTVWCTAK